MAEVNTKQSARRYDTESPGEQRQQYAIRADGAHIGDKRDGGGEFVGEELQLGGFPLRHDAGFHRWDDLRLVLTTTDAAMGTNYAHQWGHRWVVARVG